MQTNPGTASHLLRKFIRESSGKGELIGRLCEEFHKRSTGGKMFGALLWRKCASLMQTSCLSFRDTLDCPPDFDENRAQQSELPRIWSGTIKQGAHRSHDVLVKACLEKFDLVKRALGVGE